MTPEAAEILALRALGWIVADDDLAGAFLGASGLASEELRGRAQDPEFLGFVLDFLLSDEAKLTAFAAETSTPPEAPMRARAALPGGDAPEWT